MNITEELELLLNNLWISKEKNKDAYYKIKLKLKPLREFASNKLGCNIIVNSNIIKLEKIPTSVDSSFKIDEFKDTLDYVLFMMFIIFLEDKAKEEQFILSDVTSHIMSLQASMTLGMKVDFSIYKHRKSFVNVMKYAESIGIVRLRDGNDNLFIDDESSEALYENTMLSHYLIRNFQGDVFTYKTPEDFLLDEEIKYKDTVDQKRYIVYRNLFFTPLMLFDEQEEPSSLYLKNYRYRISKDIEEYLNAELCLYKNMALINLYEKSGRQIFPNYRMILSDIVLLVNHYLKEEVTSFDEDDYMVITKEEFRELIKKIHSENKEYFGSTYRNLALEKLMQEILNYMKEFKMLKEEATTYKISPIVGLLHGEYRKLEEKEDFNQLSLDLEDENE